MKIILIAGMAKNRVIGNKGDLPWYLSEDLKRFKELTMGKPVIMGRNTFDSIVKRIGKPLPGRLNIVLTSKKLDNAENLIFVDSIDKALVEAGEKSEEVYVIGGQKVYEQIIGLADKLELTLIDKDYEGDAFFPELVGWKEKNIDVRESGDLKYSFVSYERD